jgi:hypothetical protein
MSTTTEQTEVVAAPDPVKKFKGYTIDELRYRMAMATLQKEFTKEQFMAELQTMINESPLNSNNSSGILGKMLRGLSFIDYALMGYSAFKSVRGIMGFFNKKRRKR